MNRVIKFRAWNKTYNWMEDHFYIGAHDGTAYDKPSRTFDTPNIEIDEFPDYELMQFTGLTDKNGVEIYEGDILSMDDLFVPVEFNDGCFQIYTNKSQGASQLMQMRAKRFVVAGNIYQNTELLK